MSEHFVDWPAVRPKVEQIVHESEEPFAPETIANALDVIHTCTGSCLLPTHVEQGYWPTISFGWDAFELEVFQDRIEVYHFRESGMEVWYEYHQPGSPFSQKFLDQLPKARTGSESV